MAVAKCYFGHLVCDEFSRRWSGAGHNNGGPVTRPFITRRRAKGMRADVRRHCDGYGIRYILIKKNKQRQQKKNNYYIKIKRYVTHA